MATIQSLTTRDVSTLIPRMLVGRVPGCELRIPNTKVSGRHAELRWSPSGWRIKDLGSHNGTQLDGEPLPPGQWRSLGPGATVAFGCAEEAWKLLDARAPMLPMAVLADGGAVFESTEGLLLLPDDQTPLACVRPLGDDWVLEQDDEQTILDDEGLVTVADAVYRIFLPAASEATADAGDGPILELVSLEFAVSLDEENVHLRARQGSRLIDLGARVHHYLLLTLARQRLEDRGEGVASEEEGWIYRDQLVTMLDTDRTRLNIDIFRARRQFADAGILDAALLVERRPSSQQLRLGAAHVSVQRA